MWQIQVSQLPKSGLIDHERMARVAGSYALMAQYIVMPIRKFAT